MGKKRRKGEAVSPMTMDDIRRLSREIQAYWGSHLYVRVVPVGTPCMDWYEVLIPEQYADWSEEQLLHTLLHEWGHRMLSPVSPHRAAIWKKAARKEGLDKNQAQLLVNLATDLWLDRAYLENPRWKKSYRTGLCEGLEAASGAFENNQKEAGALEASLFRILLGLYQQVLTLTSGTGLERKTPALSDGSAFRQAAEALTPEQKTVVSEAMEILFSYARPPEEKIRCLARLLKPWLPKEPEKLVYLLSQPHFGEGPIKNAGELTARLEAEAGRAGLTQKEINELFGKKAFSELRQKARRLEMYARIVPVVKSFMEKRARSAFSGYKRWQVGQPVAEMDVVATLQRSGRLIPGVNTLSKNFRPHGTQHGQGAGAVVLVIDDSGSTDGQVIMREKEAAFAVIAAAREHGDPVGLVVFGSGVTASRELSSRYADLEDIVCRLNAYSGGTELAPAIKKGLDITGDRNEFALILMTDAEIADARDVFRLVHNLPFGAKVIAFCFNEPEAIREAFAPILTPNFRVFSALPEKPFYETALEEIYG